jgi:hypothetical protein
MLVVTALFMTDHPDFGETGAAYINFQLRKKGDGSSSG